MRTPEGQTMVLEIDALLDRLCGRRMDTGEVVLPDGVKWAHTVGPVTLWVHQTPPRVHCLRWIAKDSPARYGPKATYRTVRVALPYVVVFATFLSARGGRPTIGNHNECFFRTEPLTSLDDTLAYPGLLNCSKFDPPEGRPLSWICTEHLDRRRSMQVKDEGERMRQGLRELLHCLLETGFNYSSEAHEGQSWFSESPRVDPRVAVVEDWQEASARDPLFALDLPWLPVGLSVREVAERIVKGHGGSRRRKSTSGDAARVLVNHGSAEPGAATANEGAQP